MAIKRQELGDLVFSTIHDFNRLERSFCKKSGLYQGQPRILTILSKYEGVTLSELSPLCDIGMPSLSVSLRNLQKAGLVHKEGSGKNQEIFLTERGKECALIFHETIDAFYESFFAEYTDQSAEVLIQHLSGFDTFIKKYLSSNGAMD